MKLSKNWVVGFTDGEGCFYVGINQHRSLKLKEQVLPEFKLVQHQRDLLLLYKIKDFFNCGLVKSNRGKNSTIYEYQVRNTKDLTEKIIPFFTKHPLQTQKKFDFNCFCQVLKLMNQKQHLTPEGLAEIKKIKNQMNRKLLIKRIKI